MIVPEISLTMQTQYSDDPECNWILNDIANSDLFLKGSFIDCTQEDLLYVYHQYPVALLEDFLEKLKADKQFAICDIVARVLEEKRNPFYS